MKKRKSISVLICSFILSVMIILTVLAGAQPRLVDNADLLSESEETALLRKLDNISERQQVDIVVVTVDSTDGIPPEIYSDDYYDRHDYRADGILLLVSLEDRELWISTAGYGITAITDTGREYIFDQFQPLLSDGDYEAGFIAYADLCDKFITQARSGRPYGTGNMPKEPFRAAYSLLISLGIGFTVAFFVVSYMKDQLKSVRFQSAAEDYVKRGSVKITESGEFFLYRHVDRRAKPKQTTSRSGGSAVHTSSSGTSHGGGGRKF